MVSFNKFQPFVEHMVEGRVNVGNDPMVIILCNAAPDATDGVYSDLADDSEVVNGNGYVTGGLPVGVTSSGQTGGTYTLVLNDLTITASGGSIGPFRYFVLASISSDSPSERYLCGYWDYGSNLTLADGESVTADFGAATITVGP